MDQDELTIHVRVIFSEETGLPLEAITPELLLLEDLEIEREDFTSLIEALDQQLRITIPRSEVANIKTVQDVIDIASEQLAAKED